MAAARKCDICGKLYEPYGLKVGDTNGISFVRIDWNRNYTNQNILDCCEECLNAIEELIKNRKEK